MQTGISSSCLKLAHTKTFFVSETYKRGKLVAKKGPSVLSKKVLQFRFSMEEAVNSIGIGISCVGE